MPTFARRETVVRHVEYGVEADAVIGEFGKVEGIAWMDYCRRTGRDPERRCDDWATVIPRDEETVIRFVVEHKPEAADEALTRVREALTALTEKAVMRSGSGREGRIDAADLALLHDALKGAGS